jgi:hypothetical protein
MRQHLPSPPATSNSNIVGFTVQQNGEITDAPAKFHAHRNDFVIWLIGNTSGQKIAVSLSDFLRKQSDSDPKGQADDRVDDAFIWLVSSTIELEDGEARFIAARRDPAFQIRGLFHDAVSYTIEVRSLAGQNPFPTVTYDPDGDIKP